MDSVKAWGLSACAALVVGAGVSMIVPSLEKNKMIKLVLSSFMLVSIVSPMLSMINSADFSLDDLIGNESVYSNVEMTDDALKLLENSSCEALYPVISEKIKEYGLDKEFGLSVVLRKKNGGVEIERVDINMGTENIIEINGLEDYLRQNLGLPIEIYKK